MTELNRVPHNGRMIVLKQVGDHHGCRGCIGSTGIGEDRCFSLPCCNIPGAGVWVEGGPLPVQLTEDPDHGDPAVPDALAHKPVHGGYPEGPRMPLASDTAPRYPEAGKHQWQRVVAAMDTGEWHTLAQLASKTRDPEASISARIREIRQSRMHGVEKRRLPGSKLFEYRLVPA